jgi:hypothetical protein
MSKMNLSTPIEILYEMKNLKGFFERLNTLNMYASLCLVSFGLFTNTVAVIVLFCAKNSLPKINSVNCLMLFTLTNIIHLLVHAYTSSYARLAYHFDLNDTIFTKLHFFDSSKIICKIFAYLKFSTRFANLSIIIIFSLERTVAVYFPFKKLEPQKRLSFFVLLLFSFIYPIYLFFMVDIFPVANDLKTYDKNISNAENFNLATLTPVLDDTVCLVDLEKEKLFVKFHLVSYFFIVLSFMLISSSLGAIIWKLHKRENELKNSIHIIRSIAESKDKQPSSTNKVLNKALSITSQVSARINKNSKTTASKIRNFKNTKVLLTLSFNFILFNLPYFFFLLIVFLNLKSFSIANKEDFLQKMRWKGYLTFVEMFQLAYFSVTGLLLFASGKIFRFHLRIWLRKLFRF